MWSFAAAIVAKWAIEVAAREAERLLKDAKDKHRNEVERCAKFLEVGASLF